MEEEYIGFKELYDINIRLNQPVKIGDRQYEINETILSFERAELAQISENKIYHAATGGFNDNLLIDWETDKEVSFAIKHGILTPTSWAALSNSKIKQSNKKSIQFQERLLTTEIEDKWVVALQYKPNNVGKMGLQGNPEGEQMPMGRREWLPLKPMPPSRDRFIFCYDCDTGNKILNFEVVENQVIFSGDHREVMIDYTFDLENSTVVLESGNRLFNGFLNLSGKITTKDYASGEPKTAILEIPRLKIRSSLGFSLGTAYDCAVVSDFNFTGYPGEGRLPEEQKVFSISFIDNELTGDYV